MSSKVAKSSETNRNTRSMAPLVFEDPCPHIKYFGPCLAEVTVYKWKMASKMATVLGFPTETHKLLLVKPLKDDAAVPPPMVLELNFGSKKLFSSGTFMHCLECAKFSEDYMVKCSMPFVCCIDKDFIIKAEKAYIETIQFFGPRKCNCQSYVYYILSCFGVPDKLLIQEKVVETDDGFIRATVKQLAANEEFERPTCDGTCSLLLYCTATCITLISAVYLSVGDVNMKNSTRHRPQKVEPLEIPSFLAQFELDEYKDEVGKKYMRVLFGLSLSSTIFFLILALVVFYYLHQSGYIFYIF